MILLLIFLLVDPVEFGNYLFERGEYRDAIIEYRRAIFIGHPDTIRILLNIGRTYFKLEEYKEVRETLQKMNSDTANAIIVLSYFCEKLLDSAKIFIQKIKSKELKDNLLSEEESLKKLKYRKPILAGLLSAILPGLGRVYADRPGDACFGFIFTVSTGFGAYHYFRENNLYFAIPMGVATLLFYLGDVYGSVASTKIYNETLYNKKLGEILRAYTELLEPE